MVGVHFDATSLEMLAVAVLAVAGMLGCSRSAAPEAATRFALGSAFADGATIPVKYTADGENISPPLTWSGAPAATKEFALIVDDPDAPAGTWDHWLIWRIPAGATELKEGLSAHRKGVAPPEMVQGKNSWGHNGYEGPEPPAGKPHRYYFRLYALDAPLDIAGGADKAALIKAMNGHILAEGELMGKYGK